MAYLGLGSPPLVQLPAESYDFPVPDAGLSDSDLGKLIAQWNTAAAGSGGTCVDPKTGASASCGPVAWLNAHSTGVAIGAAALLGGLFLLKAVR